VVAARVGLGGVILDRRDAPRERGPFDLEALTAQLAGFAHQMLRDTARDAVCVGAAAAIAGGVRAADGVVKYGPNLGAYDVPFGEELARRLDIGMPVAVGNDANLGALAEHTRGVGVGCNDLIYLHGDVGIGGGVIVGGQLLSGHAGYGGEVGHMVVNPGGRLCGCGSRGCLEAEVGERTVLEAAGRAGGGRVGRDAIRDVVEAADRGDVVAQRALQRVGDWLGIGVANLVNIFNPEMVIFGGMLREIFLGSAAQVRSRIATAALSGSREGLRLRTSALGDDATLTGAAELAFAGVLADPLEALARVNSN
jgi:predicted NBD/HSP70 family sugar kinase